MAGVSKNRLDEGCSMTHNADVACAMLQKIAQPRFSWLPSRTHWRPTSPEDGQPTPHCTEHGYRKIVDGTAWSLGVGVILQNIMVTAGPDRGREPGHGVANQWSTIRHALESQLCMQPFLVDTIGADPRSASRSWAKHVCVWCRSGLGPQGRMALQTSSRRQLLA